MLFNSFVFLLLGASLSLSQSQSIQDADVQELISNLQNERDVFRGSLCKTELALNEAKMDLEKLHLELEKARSDQAPHIDEDRSNLTAVLDKCTETEALLKEKDEEIRDIRRDNSITIEELKQMYETKIGKLEEDLQNVTETNSDYLKVVDDPKQEANVTDILNNFMRLYFTLGNTEVNGTFGLNPSTANSSTSMMV